MPALRPHMPPGPPSYMPTLPPVAGIVGEVTLQRDFSTVSNYTRRLPPSATGVEWPAPERTVRRAGDGPCNTRYPIQGGFTRQSTLQSKHVSPDEHVSFLREHADSAVFGELLEMLRPVDACPNRRYRHNVELRDELAHRIVCLRISGHISVGEMALRHEIPSLLLDSSEYFPGSIGANFYDIGFEVLVGRGLHRRAIHEMPMEDVRNEGSREVKRILASDHDPRDMYSGFSQFFRSLQFHAHANGIQDAADMLDRITRDDSFGRPLVGAAHASTFLIADGYALSHHLHQCALKRAPTQPPPSSGICAIL